MRLSRGLISALLGATLVSTMGNPAAADDPEPPPPSNGYVVYTDVTGEGSSDDGGSEDHVTCRYDEVQILGNTRTVTGSVTIANIDGMRFKFDSATGLAWLWSSMTCRNDAGELVDSDTVWYLLTVIDPAIAITPAYDDAIDMIEPPAPLLSPVGRGVVNLGMWLAVAEQDEVSAIANIPTAWAEVRATQKATTFDFGNGDTVTCDGLGSPIPESEKDTLDEGPCGYTYRSANDGEPYTITITSTWAITWELSDGRTGTRPDVTLTTTFEYPVVEIQTVGTNG